MNLFSKPYFNVAMLQTTSKDALKRSALMMCDGDIKKATEIYEFFMKDVENMPDFDTPPAPFIEQAKSTVGEVFGFFDQNKDKIISAIDLIKSMRGGGGAPPIPNQPLPPLV
jgi:hypothetical protein